MAPFTKIPYDDARDFLRVRDLLVRTYQQTGEARNWMIDRWEFCRTFAHTMMQTRESWPQTVGVWVDAHEEIVAVATSEGENRGEAHFLLNLPPGPLPPEVVQALFDHVDGHLGAELPGQASVQLRIWEGYPDLEAEAIHRGMRRAWTEVMSHKPLQPTETGTLPDGYRIAWGHQVDDNAKGRVHVRAFGYESDPGAQRTADCWKAMRTMPDWRSELELFVLAPDGTAVAFVNLWLDGANHLAICEPVGTDPDHRRLGLARALILEGGRRAAVLGARELLVGSDQSFYLACGFVPRERHGVWQR